MNDQEFKNRIEERWGGDPKMRSRGRVLTGVLLFFIGILLLLRTANLVWFPHWFFTWPMILIAVGIFSGLKHGFRGGIWIMFLLIGGLFMANQVNPDWHMEKYIWPIVLIAMGIAFILRPRRHHRWRKWQEDQNKSGWQQQNTTGLTSDSQTTGDAPAGDYDRRDFIDVTAVFGGVKKNILSKNFRGGEITSFMGGSEIDLSQADIPGRVVIDVTNIFGGTKLIVPSGWDVQNDVTAVFGGVDDKRQINGVTLDPNKILVLDGTCLFGGIEIRSF